MLDLQETYFASSDPNLFIFYYPLPISLWRGGKIQSNMAEILSVVKANTTLNMQLNEKIIFYTKTFGHFLSDGVDNYVMLDTGGFERKLYQKNVIKENQNWPEIEFVFFKLLNDVFST